MVFFFRFKTSKKLHFHFLYFFFQICIMFLNFGSFNNTIFHKIVLFILKNQNVKKLASCN